MMKRSGILLCIFVIAACSSGHEGRTAPENPREIVFCALGGASRFTGSCSLERSLSAGLPVLIVRHPDGGFRRFAIGRDNNGLITADGADQAGVALNGTLLDVRVGQDRYRLPLEQPKVDAHAR